MRIAPLLLPISCLLLVSSAVYAQPVGTAAAVNQSAHGTPPSQAIRTITLGDKIIHNERIETDAKGLLQILLADGTTFTVGPGSELTIDSFVYDPNAGAAKITASLGKGVFRFIGGRTSKTENGVRLNTPVGTVGIRGAIADLMFEPGGKTPSHIDLRYGDGITLWRPGGSPIELYEAGYSIVIEGLNDIHVRRTPEWWTGFFQALISGRGGAGGGVTVKPTGGMVIASRIAKSNSDVPLELNSIPIPIMRPREGDRQVIEEGNEDFRRRVAKDLIEKELAGGGDDDGGEDPGGGDGPDDGGVAPGGGEEPGGGGGEPPVTVTKIPMQILIAPTDPTGEGIVGGSELTTIDVEGEDTEGTVTLTQGTIRLPVYDSANFTSHELNAVASTFGSFSGMAYSGTDEFAAYLLHKDGDPTRFFYAVTGTSTDMEAAFTGGEIRHYSLTDDPIQGIGGVPFMRNDIGINLSDAVKSDFLVAEPGTPGDGSGRVLQTWLVIEGERATQQSAIGVNVGALNDTGFSLDRRGSYRSSSDGTASQLFGNAATLAMDGAGFFGTNGQNFVVGDDMPGQPGHFHDSPSDSFATGENFSTIHVGNLTGEVADPTRSLDGEYQGFAAGLIEGTFNMGSGIIGQGRYLGWSTGPSDTTGNPFNMTIAFDPAKKSLGGSITIYTETDYTDTGAPQDLTVAFGDGGDDNLRDGASAYIDDDTFAAAGNPSSGRSYVHQQSVSSGASYQREEQEAGTYLVSGSGTDLVALGTSEDHLCTACDFLKWGWWGTQVQVADPSDPASEAARYSVHLGTWVAGDISDVADIDSSELAGKVGTYQGMAVGNVVSGGAAYVAAGDMDLSYDFGRREGTLEISNFDGRSFGGTMNGATGGKATFYGSLSGTSGFVGGDANGAFVNDGSDVAKGVIGNFDVMTSEGDWRANGIFAGGRTSLTTPTK